MKRSSVCGLGWAFLWVSLALPVRAEPISATDILNLLIEEGVVSQEKVKALVEKVRTRQQKAEEKAAADELSQTPGVVRAPYVPPHVTDQIRQDVVQDLRSQVTEDVISHAKTERWGTPDALPQWVNRISFHGDARIRYQADLFADDNPPDLYWDLDAINKAGGTIPAGRSGFTNVTDDRHRLRGRFRFGIKAKPTTGFEVGLRLVTGNEGDPVSANQTFSMYDGKWGTSFDRAYLLYHDAPRRIELIGGRFANPWLHSDMVWDDDLAFQGLAARWHWLRSDDLRHDSRQWDPFVTAGVFPLDEINEALVYPSDEAQNNPNNGKWLYAGQAGTHYDFIDQSRLSFGLAWYKFENVTGEDNAFGDDLQDSTAPPVFQFGNTVQNINISQCASDENCERWALAAEFELVNATLVYDYAGFSPYHVTASADVVKNIAFDAEEVASRMREDSEVPERDLGFQVGVAIGWPEVSLRDTWKISFVYRRLEGDAVIDAFTDSDFLLGGTDARGYIIRADYAIADNVWASLRWLSADQIDPDALENIGVDTLMLDLNTKF